MSDWGGQSIAATQEFIAGAQGQIQDTAAMGVVTEEAHKK